MKPIKPSKGKMKTICYATPKYAVMIRLPYIAFKVLTFFAKDIKIDVEKHKPKGRRLDYVVIDEFAKLK